MQYRLSLYSKQDGRKHSILVDIGSDKIDSDKINFNKDIECCELTR